MELFQKKTQLNSLLVKPKFLAEPIDILTKLNSPFSTKCKTIGLPAPITKWEKLSPNGSLGLFRL